MKKILLALCLMCTAFISYGVSLTPDEVNTSSLFSIISQKYNAEKTESGNIKVKQAGINYYVTINAKTKMVRIFFFIMKNGRTRAQQIVRANKINHEKIFIRVAIDKDDDAVCDHYINYRGGLNSQNLLDDLDWCFSIYKDCKQIMEE